MDRADQQNDQVIGFVGLGQMGLPMASRLLDGGYRVLGCDTSAAAGDRLQAIGGTVAESPADVGRKTDVVIVMVPSRNLEAVFDGTQGLLASVHSGTVVIEGGNSDPRQSAELAARIDDRGGGMLDVGFSGGVLGAVEGRLAMMVGGSRQAFDEVEPLLHRFGDHIGYFGGSGSGHLAKALNHLVQALTAQAIGEALAVGEAAGIDLKRWVSIVSSGAAGSWVMDRAAEMLEADKPDPYDFGRWWQGHGARNQLSYVTEAAEASATAAPLAALGHQLRVLSLEESRPSALDYYTRITWTFAHTDQYTGGK